MPISVTSPVTAVVSSAAGLGDGSAGAPCVAFLSDTTTGFYKSAGATCGVACDGAVAFEFSATALNCHNIALTNVGNITCKSTGQAIINLNAVTGIAAGVDITAIKSLAFIAGKGAITNCSSIDSPDATTTVHGQMPFLDKAFLDTTHAAAGTTLTDTSTQSMLVSAGYWRKLPTLGQNGALSISATGAVAGDQVTITRTDTSAFTYTIKDLASTATLITLPASKMGWAKLQFDGTNFALREFGVL
jgi:hypothetical protein